MAKLKLKKGVALELTMAEMAAIAFVSFGGTVLKGDKATHAKALEKLIKEQPTILNLATVITAPREAIEPPPLATVEAAPQRVAVEPPAVPEPPAAARPPAAVTMTDAGVQLAVAHRPVRQNAWQGPPPGEGH
eukprot:7181969-Prymnesium_polylepis.1